MEVERLVGILRSKMGWYDDYDGMPEQDGCDYLTNCPIQLDPGRTVATVAKMLVDQGEEQLAGVLVQILGSGVPYEVKK